MSEEKMLTIEIDGKKIEAPQGSMLIKVADDAGIHIPRFCYHEKLSIAANCRMCLVDVERMPKPAPACATPISDGMIVRTRSEKAREAQRAIMEFLLINHPLDCPVCDQGGECELQDFSVGYGQNKSLFEEEKRHVEKKDIGPLVETFMDRCIQCTRCVRYGDEIAGIRELGGVNRGDRLEITTYVEHSLESEVSANIIDICPVGALTAKPSKFQARPWEYVSHDSISIHDGLGTNTHIHTFRGDIARVVSKRKDSINEMWIADRDRFSYEAIHSKDRALKPLISDGTDGKLIEASWSDGLTATRLLIEGLIKKYGAKEIGVIVSPSATTEELFLLKRITTKLNIKNLDYRLDQLDFSDDKNEPAFRSLGLTIEEVNHLDSVFLVGADPRMEVPVLAIRMRDAVKKGAKVSMLSTYEADQLHELAVANIVHPVGWINEMAAVLQEVASAKKLEISENIATLAERATVSDSAKQIASQLINGEKQWIVLGKEAISHPNFAVVKSLAMEIARLLEINFGYITQGANASGAALTECYPIQGGLNISEMFEQQLKAYILIGALDPEYDFYLHQGAEESLAKAEVVISMTPFASDILQQISTVILPIAAWGETSGTLVNLEGKLQEVNAAANPKGEARPLWKILRVLGNEFKVHGFDYVTSKEVLADWKAQIGKEDVISMNNFTNVFEIESIKKISTDCISIPVTSIYSTDAYVRRSAALQAAPLAKRKRIVVDKDHVEMVKQSDLAVKDKLDVKESYKIAKNCVRIPTEYASQLAYFEAFEEIQ